MKGKIITLSLICALTVIGCTQIKATTSQETQEYTEQEYQGIHVDSEVKKKDCCICGDNEKSLMSYYRKIDSVGVVCLNTMNISNTNVRIYDDNGNEIIHSDSMNHLFNSYGEKECSFSIAGCSNRGYAHVTLTYGEESVLNWEKIKTYLCQDCLDKVVDMYNNEMDSNGEDKRFPDVCLIDFQTNELYTLGKKYGGYMIRDYYIDIDHREDHDDLLIFYAPERVK